MLPADIYPLIICNLHDRETWISARYVDKLWYAIIMQIEKEPVYDQLVQFNNHGLYCETDYTTIPRLKNKMIHGIVTHVIYSNSKCKKLIRITYEKYIHNMKYIEIHDASTWEDRLVVYHINNCNIHMLYSYNKLYDIIIELYNDCRFIFHVSNNIIHNMCFVRNSERMLDLSFK